jgi:hypothetical protein
MTYVEFPFDRIIELHVKTPDEPPDPDKDDFVCGEYEREIGGEFNLGTGVDGAWFVGGQAILAGPNGIAIPDPANAAGVVVLSMTNAKKITIDWSLSVSEVSANDRPDGDPIREWSGTQIGIGFTDLSIPPGAIVPPAEPQEISGGSVPGAFSLTATRTITNKTYAIYLMSTGTLALHNIATETPGPQGWNDNHYPTTGLIKITGICSPNPPPVPPPAMSAMIKARFGW